MKTYQTLINEYWQHMNGFELPKKVLITKPNGKQMVVIMAMRYGNTNYYIEKECGSLIACNVDGVIQ